MQVAPYLFFEGRCEEAIAYYEAKLGAERLDLMRFREAPDPPPPGVMRMCPGKGDVSGHRHLAATAPISGKERAGVCLRPVSIM